MTEPDITAFEFAAAVAPEIDRVSIAVHPIARPAADAVQQLDDGPVAERIEAETNRLAALPYVDFSDAERAAFLAGLARLARI